MRESLLPGHFTRRRYAYIELLILSFLLLFVCFLCNRIFPQQVPCIVLEAQTYIGGRVRNAKLTRNLKRCREEQGRSSVQHEDNETEPGYVVLPSEKEGLGTEMVKTNSFEDIGAGTHISVELGANWIHGLDASFNPLYKVI